MSQLGPHDPEYDPEQENPEGRGCENDKAVETALHAIAPGNELIGPCSAGARERRM